MGSLLGFLTVVVVGLMVGVEFAVAVFVNPIFDRLPDGGGLRARSDGARVLGRVMPFWYIGSVLLAAAWTAVSWGDTRTWAVLTGGLLLVVSVIMSGTLLVPINNRVAQWSTGIAPTDWRQQMHRWDRLHYVRVGVIVVGFALLVLAR